jgi:trimethylamine--corrinoid protein Co-methyltransferase
MTQRLEMPDQKTLDTIHQCTLEVLSEVGVRFPSEKTRNVFQEHGFRVEGEQVFITDGQIGRALKTADKKAEITARNPRNSLRLGGKDYFLGATGGAPNLVDMHGNVTPGTVEVYKRFCKLVQTSDINMPAAHGCCYPTDVPLETCHLDMLFYDVTMTDKVLLLNSATAVKVMDGLNIAALIFGGMDAVKKSPHVIGGVNVCSPLAYAYDQSEALMVMASHRQPAHISNMMMLGTTAPLDIPSAQVVSNAEILAGVVLSQLVGPGCCVIYGTTSCPNDMKTMVAALGAPETMIMSRLAMAMARYYDLPCRTGGSLTDSHLCDAQAMLDGALMLKNALDCGAHALFHSFGMMGSYIAASLEKFVLDEELACMLIASEKMPEFSPGTINMDLIKRMGSKGYYITQPETMKNFKKLYRPKFLNRWSPEKWKEKGGLSAVEAAHEEVKRRLAIYEKPHIDPKLEEEITAYVNRRKQERSCGPQIRH